MRHPRLTPTSVPVVSSVMGAGVYRTAFLNANGAPLWMAIDGEGRRVLEVAVSGRVTEGTARSRCERALHEATHASAPASERPGVVGRVLRLVRP